MSGGKRESPRKREGDRGKKREGGGWEREKKRGLWKERTKVEAKRMRAPRWVGGGGRERRGRHTERQIV